ncbi:MAG: NAD(P)H-quinone oxidoreductase subunit O [Cyanobacteria bacterium P01_E01_bin.34]
MPAIKRGAMVRAIPQKMENSVEAQASDPFMPTYIYTTDGEVLDVKDEYAQVKFGSVPTPAVWLRLDQLEEVDG